MTNVYVYDIVSLHYVNNEAISPGSTIKQSFPNRNKSMNWNAMTSIKGKKGVFLKEKKRLGIIAI